MNPRLRRLQADYDAIRAAYSGHSAVEVRPSGQRLPPEVYEIRYSVPGVTSVSDGEPELANGFRVELRLPRRYPAEPPYAVPKSPIFHPNVSEYFCIADDWRASTPITDVIARLGDMIQWREFNLASPLDEKAAEWAASQDLSRKFPVGDVEMTVGEVHIADKAAPQDGSPDNSGFKKRSRIDLSEEFDSGQALVTLKKDKVVR